MARNLQLLLLETVDGTGIIGDVVQVRKGFARNYLLPRGMAMTPDEARIKELQTKRKDAIKQLGVSRKQREEMITKMVGTEITMIRSVNDVGILYAAITQQEIASELAKAGYPGVLDREVRLAQPIKRIGDYNVTVKFSMSAIPNEDGKGGNALEAASAEAEIKLHIKPDRELEQARREREEAEEAANVEKRQKDKGATFATDKPKTGNDEAPATAGKGGKGGAGVKAAAPAAEAPKAAKAEKKK